MVSAEDAVRIIERLSAHGIGSWVCGGWGIDALLGRETRPHKDLDLLVPLDDIVRARELFEWDGYSLRDLWSENLPAVDGSGTETATAFVLRDSAGREIDLHAIRLDADGNGIPTHDGSGMVFGKDNLAGSGTIGGFPVRCLGAEMQFRCHTGYTLPETQVRDLHLLRERCGGEPCKRATSAPVGDTHQGDGGYSEHVK